MDSCAVEKRYGLRRKFSLSGSDGQQVDRRRANEEFRPDCTVSTVKYLVAQMVWGCISYQKMGRLKFVQGTVNAQANKYILQRKETLAYY